MKCGKAVEEVWKWRDELDEELSKVPKIKRVDYLHEMAVKMCEKYGILYKLKDRKKAAA